LFVCWTSAHLIVRSRFTIQTIAAYYAYRTTGGDLPGWMVIAWFMWAVFVQQAREKSPFVHWCALGAAIMSLCWLMRSAIGLEFKIWSCRRLTLSVIFCTGERLSKDVFKNRLMVLMN